MAGKKNIEEVVNENTEVVEAPVKKPIKNERFPYRARVEKGEEPEIFVGVNGANKTVQRGATVMLPSSFIEVLDNSEKESDKATLIENQMSDAYKQSLSDLQDWKKM